MKRLIIIIASIVIAIAVGCSRTDSVNKIEKLLLGSEEADSAATDCGANYLVREKYILTAPDKINWVGKSVVYVFPKLGDNTRNFTECLVTAYFTAPKYNRNLNMFVLAIIDLKKNGIIYYAIEEDNMFTVRTVAKIENRQLYRATDYMYRNLKIVLDQLGKGTTHIPFRSERDEDYFSLSGILALYNTFTEGNTESLLEEAYGYYLAKSNKN